MRIDILSLNRQSVEGNDAPRQSSINPAALTRHRGVVLHRESGGADMALHPAAQEPSALRRVYDYVEMHLAGELTLAELGASHSTARSI